MTKREEKSHLIKRLMAIEAAELEQKITSPIEVLPELDKYRNRKQEEFIVITLNGAHEVIKVRSVSKGLVNRTLVHPREIFRPALLDNAAAVILAHNHPSGQCTPSKEDTEITIRLKKAGDILGIEILDHIIVSKKGYYSFLESGTLF